MKKEFETVYNTKFWKSEQSVSGSGSDLANASTIAKRLSQLIKTQFGKGTEAVVVDCPCGDYNWQHLINTVGVVYTGFDIVPALIEANKVKHPQIDFHVGDICETNFGFGNLLIVRDCLVHLPSDLALQALRNIASQDFDLVAITHFGGQTFNRDTIAPRWRPMNLMLPPFNLPTPFVVLLEDCKEGGGAWADKSLAVFRVDDLRQHFQRQA